MNRYLKMIGVPLLVGSMSMAAPAFGGETKTAIADSWVTARTMIALAADARVKGHQVSVETSQGVVKLRGKVDDAQAKKVAWEIAGGMDGVKRVDNELQVVAPEKRDAVKEKDEDIVARVKEQIRKDADVTKDGRLKEAGIDVVSNAGVVSLTGKVPDLVVSAQASWTAWQVSGVKSVKNDLVLARE